MSKFAFTAATMFEVASRVKLRFATVKGLLSLEQIWDLPLTSKSESTVSLDSVAKDIHSQIREADTAPISFVNPAATSGASDELKLKFELLKHIIAIRVAEAEKREKAATKADERRRLQDLLNQKKLEKDSAMSIEDLEARIAALGVDA